MKRFARWFDFVFVLRPTLFFPVWTVFAAGYLRFHALSGQDGQLPAAAPPVLVGFLLTLLMGGAFVLNQLHDVETDRQNNKLFLIAHGHISARTAKLETWLLLVASVGSVVLLRFEYGILFLIIFLLTGLLYSCKPFIWKDRPWLGLLANAAGACLVFTAGWWTGAIAWREIPQVFGRAAPYMAAVGAVYLYTTLLDVAGDRRTGKRTFGVTFGRPATVISGAALEGIALATAWLLRDPVMLFPAGLAAPFFIVAAIRQRDEDVHRAIKLPILLLAVAICFHVIEYLLLLVFVYFFSKWYYLYRFGIVYPSFRSQGARQ